MFHLFDTYSAGISLLCSALFEAIAVSWFYGKLFSFTIHITSKICIMRISEYAKCNIQRTRTKVI